MKTSINENHIQNWLEALPADSIHRLRMINLNTHSSRHVILTVAFSIYDPHIFCLSKMIAGLLVARLRAERKGQTFVINKINSLMENLHHAIDNVTQVHPSQRGDGHACSRKTSLARNRRAAT